ncbi:uncharacterized protein LOC121415003 [Lytechinus variegatus]|uniref:uncharacterized protein LOC121415003 n=1 Tax=Lytechinus variegatus TaxID=7654 RepID=UPI001BB10971|nr:uncharacterized protein LOC121415003 [Lytechinus variegatus]
MMESTCTPKSSQSRFISQGCKKHTRLRHRPLQFTHDFISVQHSAHSNSSLASLFEESSLCSSLGEIDTSWFDSERWTSNDETKWKKEDILKTPQASQRESKIFSTPGLFTPDRPSPVCKQCKDYPECNPPQDEESASSFVRPKRFRKVPSSIHTTPNSQIITSHQPTSGPMAETIQEEDEGERGPVDVQFSPFPTWNPTSNKDTPIFMKHLFKTPSTLFGAGDKRACSTPLQRLSTPQRLSRSLGAEPEESDLSWTSSLATPPMSSKSKTVTSSNKKHIEDDTWQTHVVAKVLFQDGGSVVEMDSCEEGDEGSTQPLKVVKFPSINDDSQEEEFTIETEDGGESDKSLGGGRKEIPAPMFNDKSDESRVQMVTRDSLVLPTSLVQPPVTDNGEPPLAKHQEHESINESVDSKTVSELYVQEGGSVREKVVGPSVDIIAELDAKKNVSGDSTETNAFSELDCKQWKKSPVQPAMSSQQSSVIGSNHASQTLFNSQESTKNDKTAMEETLAFLLATPPSRRGKLLDRLCASGSSIGVGTFIEQGACDALGSILDVKNKLSDSSQSAPMKSVLDDTFMSPPAGLLCKPMKSGFDEGQERKSLGSESSMNGKPDNGVVETPSRPAPDVDLLSPISPNYAEALCRVTDIASREQPIGSKNTLSGQKSLGVERNLIDIFENPYYEEIIHIKVTDQLRSGGHDDPLVKQTLHPTEANRPNTSVAKNSSSLPSSLPSSANNKLPKPFLSKLEACEAMSTSKPVAVANLKTQSVTKGRFKYTPPAQAPRKDGGNISKTPSWLSRAVYVEEEEDEKKKEEKKVDAVQAETLGESSKKGWTMKRPCPLPTSFTTFSTFCKTAPNPLTRAIPTAESQTASSTTPTSSRSAILSAPPHNKSLVRIREFPHSWPSPKRLRLDEERDECNMESDMKSNLLPIDECDVKIPNLAPVGSDEMPPRTQDQVSLVINNAGNGQECVEDLHNKFNSTDNVLFTEVHGTTQNVGFSSASGRAIFVSSESLKKAEKLIGDVDKEKPPEEYQLNLSSADPQCGFQSASGKSIQVSDEALTKAKKIIDEVGLYDETIHDSPGKSSLSVGFTSARGNVINISAAAMAKARTIMNDINHDEESKSIGQEGRVVEISGRHHVDGGGDRNMIQNKKGVQSGGLSGNAQLKRTMENRQRHKGFRPFKPPSLVANIQKPSHLTSSIPSLNQTSEIELIKESDRGNGLKTGEDCIPVGLQEGNKTMPELKIITLQQEQKIETSESSNMPREKKKLDSGNLQSIENSDISDDDCLSATQAAREIKAAEEMELVYNFMQEEDTGFSQLDVSSIIAAGHSEKGAAQILKCPEYHTDPNKERQVSNSRDHQMFNHTIGPTSSQDFLSEQRGNVSLMESKLKRSKAMGAIKETTDRNEVLSTSMKHNDVQFEMMVQKRIDESKQYLASPNHAERVTLDLKQNGDYSKVETDTIKESPAVDQSVKMIGQVMDDNAILTKETEGLCTLSVKDKEQQEVSHTDTHEPYQGTCSIDVTKISRSAQQSSYVRHVECIDESLSNDKNKAHIPGDHLQPDILNATSYQENDSIPDQKKRDKPRLKMDVTLEACGPVGFKTVEGQTIEVSEAALQKATLLLSDHNSDGETNKQLNPDISDKSFNQLIPTVLAHCMSISHATCHQENMELPEQAKIPECRPLINVLQGEKLLIDDNNCGSTIRNSSMSEEEPASSSVSEVCQAGLQTAGGKDIKVAKSALQMAKTVIGDNHENNPLNYSIDSKASKDIPGSDQDFVNFGFQTAGGNKVYVSNSALQKARKVIESALENVPECSPGRSSMIHQNTTDSKTTSYTMNKHDIVHSEQASQKYSSQTGLSPKVAALEPVLSEYNVSGNLSNTESGLLVAFHTASGNKISISDDALQKARRLVSNEIKSFDEGAIEKSTTDSHSKQVAPIDTFENINGDWDEISDALPIGERQPIANDTDLCNNGNTANQHDRASVARDLNSNIPFSKSRLQRKKYGDSFDNSLGQMGLEFITKSSPRKLGFQTARGGAISVSDESLKKAKQLLRKDSRHENIQEISGLKETLFESSKLMTGLQTGSGKHIQVSESAIQVGKQLLSNDLDISNGGATSSLHQKHPDSAELEVGFQTGDGRRIQVSESSILKARQLLCDESNQKVMEFSGLIKKETSRQVQLDPAKSPDTFIGEEKQDNTSKESSVPTNRKTRDQQVKRVSRSLESQKSHIKSVPVGFQSGHGRKVQISEVSLQRAKEFLADESSEVPDQNIAVGFQTGHGKKVKVSEASLLRAKKFLADESSEVPDQNTAAGFQTGHGKKVQVSEASLQRAKEFLADESSEVPDKNIAVGFQTGHGKKVQVSEASLQRAKEFLVDESSEVPDQNIVVGFKTGHGKKVQVSEASLQRAKEFLSAGSDAQPDHNIAVSFQTGHGTKVQVSEATLQRPKQSLAMESDVGTELHDSAVCGDAYEESFSSKSYMMTGFMTGDGRKVQVSEASLQLAKNNLDSEIFTDVSREIGQRELHVPPGSQHQNLSSSADGNSPTHQGKDLTENQKLGREPLKGGCSLTNLPPQKHLPGGLTKRGLVDMRNRQLNQQSNRRGSLPTGQKPYKPPRRVNEKVSSSSRGLVPRGSNPTVILNDRTKPIKALQSSPPSSSRHSISNERLHETGPFLKPSLNLHTTTTNQSQNKLEATPIPEEGACSFVARWDEARRAQQQRINAKRGRLIKPELGSLWRCRKEEDRISLKDFVNHQYPCSMTDSQLFGNGILCSTLSVRPSNAEGYEFAGEDHFSPTCLENSQGILLADGGRLVFNSSCLVGKKEFYNALLDTPGVDPKLLKEDWVYNHYKWIIWKAAAMEVAYPLQFGGRLLTPNWVLLQLKYRYDREIDHSQRPALRKILERDDAASRRMVLCVAAINHTGSSTQHHGKSPQQSKSSQPSSHPTLELTDGWYSISTIIDTPLANYVRSGKILCGTKLCIYGAELIGSQDACSPLEIPESLKLKIAANSTRRARFDSRLGLQCDPRPFPLPTTSLHPDGGSVGCIDVLILRTYPMQFMEKLPEGGSVFRNAKEEAKAATLHANQKQHKMEQLFTQVQKQFEAKQSHKVVKGRRSLPSSRSRNSSELERLQSGEELFEALEAAIDPSAFESDLSEYQRCILHAYQRTLNDMKQANLQAAFNQALAQQNKEGKFERNVVPLMKVRVADYKASTTRGQQTTFLTIWRPADDLLSQLVEGKRFRISSLSTSAGRNMPDMAPVQLASTRATRYEEIPAASHILQRSYIPRAAASMQWLGRGYTQAAYGELDVVGVVVSQDEPRRQHPGSSHSHVVYLADQDTAIMAIKFWTSPTALNLDDMLKPGSFISASNLHYRSTQSPVVLPTATASDYTVFTPNPKANYLQVSINQLKQAIKDTPKFVEMVQRKVQELKDASSKPTYPSSIPRNHPYMARRERITTPIASQSQTRIGIQPTPEVSHGQGYQLMTVRSCPKNFMKTSKSIKDEVCNTRMKLSGISRVSSTLTPRTPCQSPVPGVSLSPRLISQHLEQERRAELLSCIPSPPPLTPLPFPAASPALRRGFKIPSPSVRGSQKREPEKFLRKRLRDELDEENDGACEQQSNKQSNAKAVDGDHTMKKQKVNNRDDTTNLETVASEPDNSNFESKMGECEAKGDNDFSDDLGLSASGLQELEMGWSQSEVLTEPAVGEQPLKMNISASEKACPLESTNSMKENKDPILVDISSENDNHSREPEDKHHAFGSESVMEGSIQPCTDVTSNITQDFHPGRQPIQYGQVVEHTTQNNDYPTNPTKIDSHMTLTCVTQTTRACTSVDSRSHSLPPLCKSINGNVKEVSGCISENAAEDTDIPVKVHANSNCTENIQETTQDTDAADNHLTSLRSPSSHETNNATKEDKSMESDLLQQSRGMDSSCQNSASINESQERSEQDKSSRSQSPKGKKRKCLRLQRKKAVVDSGAVIEILEDDNSPLLKRSSRLRVQEKKSYKL